MKPVLALFLSLIISTITFFNPINDVVAVSTTLSSYPQIISHDTFTLKVTIENATAATNYLRIDLYKAGTKNYFGETFGAHGWYSESIYSEYLPVTILKDTIWNGEVQGRLGTPSLADYSGPGSYKMRVRRYTQSGNYTADEANASAVDVSIVFAVATPTAVPTSVPQATHAPTPSPTSPPVVSTPIPAAPKSSISASTENQIELNSLDSPIPTVLAVSATLTDTLQTSRPEVYQSDKPAVGLPSLLFAIVCILVGIGTVWGVSIKYYHARHQMEYNSTDDKNSS